MDMDTKSWLNALYGLNSPIVKFEISEYGFTIVRKDGTKRYFKVSVPANNETCEVDDGPISGLVVDD